MSIFVTRCDRDIKMQHLISIAFDESTTITHNVSVIQIVDAVRMRKIVAIHKFISQISILTLRRSIHHLFSFRKEFVSDFFDDEMLLAIDQTLLLICHKHNKWFEIEKIKRQTFINPFFMSMRWATLLNWIRNFQFAYLFSCRWATLLNQEFSILHTTLSAVAKFTRSRSVFLLS
jgi:hypothetical protein